MKKTVIDIYSKAKESLIESIFDYVNKTDGKSCNLHSCDNYNYDIERIWKHIYKRLFIDKGELLVDWEIGEGFEPIEYQHNIDNIHQFAIDEICAITDCISE
ncbi:MAG: hypothetical protein J6T88_09195 [Bacteroidales bacterium]|nr:hypothetical protein [Bacteroidales bacterium]